MSFTFYIQGVLKLKKNNSDAKRVKEKTDLKICSATDIQTGIQEALMPKYFFKYVSNTLVVANQHVFRVTKPKLKLTILLHIVEV